MYTQENQDWISDKSDEEHAAYQHKKEPSVLAKDFWSVFCHSSVDQAQNAKGSAGNDPAYDNRNGVRQIRKEILSWFAGVTNSNTQHNSPCQNAQVVCVHQGIDRIGNDVVDASG